MSIRIHFAVLALTFIFIASFHSPDTSAQSHSVRSDAKAGHSKSKPDDTETRIREILNRHGHEVQAAVWLGGVDRLPFIERNANVIMPSASAIKTFFLVEFFASHKDSLDAPVPAADKVLADDAHPAISHFTADQKQDIRKTLAGRSARELGEIMMGKAPASNVAYNAAANVIMAVSGGPERLTARIQARDPAFSKVFVRRYMLRDRNEHGDNETTAAALAALYRNLANKSLNEIEPGTIVAIRNAIIRTGSTATGFAYMKTGALDSDPLTRVEAGWKEASDGTEPVVFVVMLKQPKPGENKPRAEAGKALAATCTSIRKTLLESTGP